MNTKSRLAKLEKTVAPCAVAVVYCKDGETVAEARAQYVAEPGANVVSNLGCFICVIYGDGEKSSSMARQ